MPDRWIRAALRWPQADHPPLGNLASGCGPDQHSRPRQDRRAEHSGAPIEHTRMFGSLFRLLLIGMSAWVTTSSRPPLV